MENGSVVSNISQGIATITFGHPQSNSLPGVILNKLAEEIKTVGANAEVRVIILRTLGEKTFCAGASFDELVAIKDYESGLEFFSGFAKVINACRTTKQLIIGRVQGKAVGGGVGIAAAVDYCFATTQADIKLSELAVGIGPFVVGPAVARKIGVSGMSELAINATAWRSAEWTKNKGLYAEVFEDIAAMDEAVDNLAIRLAQSNPEAMFELKRIFWQGTEDWDQLLTERAGISGRLVLSEFTRNAILAFKSK